MNARCSPEQFLPALIIQSRLTGQREAIVAARSVELFDEGERRQRGGTDGKALAGRGGGVAEGVERVGALAGLFGKPPICAMPLALSATGP